MTTHPTTQYWSITGADRAEVMAILTGGRCWARCALQISWCRGSVCGLPTLVLVR